MPRLDYKTCKGCGRKSEEVGPLSHTRLCGDCAQERVVANMDGLYYHRGPALRRWRQGVVHAAGGVLLDELDPQA